MPTKGIAACVILAAALLWAAAWPARSSGPAKRAAPRKARASVMFRMKGLRVKVGGKPPRSVPAFVRIRVRRGDEIRTNAHSQAEIFFDDKVTVRLKENSVLRIEKDSYGKSKALQIVAKLFSGKALVKVKKLLGPRTELRLHTPIAVAAVRGTEFVMDASKPGPTVVEVLKGEVSVAPVRSEKSDGEITAGEEVEVKAGLETSVAEGKSPTEPAEIPPEELQADQQWEGESDMGRSSEEEPESQSGEEGSVEAVPDSEGTEEPEVTEPGEQGGDEDQDQPEEKPSPESPEE